MSVASDAPPRAVRSLESILSVAEGTVLAELLFTFVLPAEVVKKYEYVREQAMQKAGLPNSSTRIWQLQREAHAKQQDAAMVLQRGVRLETDNERSELITRLDSAHELLRNYQRMIVCVCTSLDDLQSLAEKATKSRRALPQLTELYKQSQDKPLRLSELESSQTKLVERFRELETEAQMVFSRFIVELSSKQSTLEASVNRLQLAALQANEEAARLQSQLNEDRLSNEAWRLKAQEESRELYESQIKDLQREYSIEKGNLLQEKASALEEAKLLSHELAALQAKHETEIDFIEAQFQQKLDHLRSSDSQVDNRQSESGSLQERLNSMKQREDALKVRIDMLTTDSNSTITALQDKLAASEESREDLHTILNAVADRLHVTYTKHAPKQKDWNSGLSLRRQELVESLQELEGCVDVLLDAEFTCYLVSKLSADNDWLIERLADFGKENEKLKRQQSGQPIRADGFHSQVMEDIKTTSFALKGFETARDRLLRQFGTTAEPKVNSPEKVQSSLKPLAD